MDTERAWSSVEPLRPPWYDQVEEISEQEAIALFKLGLDVRHDWGYIDLDADIWFEDCKWEGIGVDYFIDEPDAYRPNLFFYLIK